MPTRKRAPRRRRPDKGVLQTHPAQTIGAGIGLVGSTAFVHGFGLEGWVATAVYAAGFAVPAAWTFLQKSGGIVGVLRTIWRGSQSL